MRSVVLSLALLAAVPAGLARADREPTTDVRAAMSQPDQAAMFLPAQIGGSFYIGPGYGYYEQPYGFYGQPYGYYAPYGYYISPYGYYGSPYRYYGVPSYRYYFQPPSFHYYVHPYGHHYYVHPYEHHYRGGGHYGRR